MNSVCVATYNGEKYIEEQLRSILVQLRPDDEVIVSDDGSTDRTCAIVESLADPRIRLLHHNGHDFKQNFVNALQHAHGEYIFLSDQDDVWLDGKYERCVQELKCVDLVCTNSKITDEHLNVVCDNFFKLYHSHKGILRNIINGAYYGSCMAFRRTLLSSALPMPSSQDVNHDLWLGLVAEMAGSVKFIQEPCLLYRRHKGALSQTGRYSSFWSRSSRPLWVKIWSRLVVLSAVVRFYIRYKIGKFKNKW